MPDPLLSAALERLDSALAGLGNSAKSLERRLNERRSGDTAGERDRHLRAEVSAVIAELDSLLDHGDVLDSG